MTRTNSTPARTSAAVNGSATSADGVAPPRRRGRRPAAELLAIRTRVEILMVQGYRAPAIHRALTGADSPNPMIISARQVRAHMTAVERAWIERSDVASIESERAKAIAMTEEAMRMTLQRSTMHAGSNIGVGYLNVHVKLLERWARFRGLDAPQRQELTGRDGGPLQVQPVAMADHPLAHLSGKERAASYRELADLAEAQDSVELEPEVG